MPANSSPLLRKSIGTQTSLSQFSAITFNGLIPAAGASCVGFTEAAAAAGKLVPVVLAGSATAWAGAAVTAGQALQIGTNGQVVPKTNGKIVGQALNSGAVGDSIEVNIQIELAESVSAADAAGNVLGTLTVLTTGVGAASANTTALQTALTAGGTVQIFGAGTYYLSTWPTGIAASTLLTIASGVTLTDGASSIIGPANLEGGIWPNGRRTLDATATNGSANITSATALFTAADVGKIITVFDPAKANFARVFSGVVTAFNSATSVAVGGTYGGTSLTGGVMYIGTDCAAAINAVLALASTNKRIQVNAASGIHMVSTGILNPDGIKWRGKGKLYTTSFESAAFGTVIVAASAGAFPTSFVVKNGATKAKTGVVSAKLEEMFVCASNKAQYAVWHTGDAAELNAIRGERGTLTPLLYDAALSRITNCEFWQQSTGYCADITSATDGTLIGNYFIGAAGTAGNPTAQVRIGGSGAIVGDLTFIGNHFWYGVPGNGLVASLPQNNVLILGRSGFPVFNTTFIGNEFDSCYGHCIQVDTDNTSAIQWLNIQGNFVFQNDTAFPDATFDFVNLKIAGAGVIAYTNISNNIGGNFQNANSWANLVNPNGTPANVTALTVNNNTISNCNTIAPTTYTAQAGAFEGGCKGNIIVNSASAKKLSSNRGRSTQTGNAVTLAFTIAHGLSDVPREWYLTPRIALAAPSFIATVDATNITVTYATAPPAVASNVDLTWAASL